MSARPRLELVVTSVTFDAPGTRTVALRASDGATLPTFPAGSHLGIVWADGRVNSYSLINPGAMPREYLISVKLDAASRGGSRWVHELAAGDIVAVVPPRSDFAPVVRGRHHVLVAGGIGITAILSHAEWHRRWGHSFEVWYVGGDVELNDLVVRLRDVAGERLQVARGREEFWSRFAARIEGAPFGSELYTCGPEPMIAQIHGAAAAAGWSEHRVHSESFVSKDATGRPFEAVLSRSGRSIQVSESVSFLDALDAADVVVPSMCRTGVCGECATRVVSGRIDHRDDYVSQGERASGSLIMPCVSRALDDRIEVEL